MPDAEDCERVECVYSFLEVFNQVTKIFSETQYPTSNLFLLDIKCVKEVIDKKAINQNHHVREMAMKAEFDKYWGESNMFMSIGAAIDPRFKIKLPTYVFPILYPREGSHLEILLV